MGPKVLLSSVFKPFGIDSIYGRKDSRIELYHNQITKYQGVFSLRSFMNSFGLYAIANNIEVPTTVLDFPTLDQFRKELKKGYDIIGISSIVPNFAKAKLMVEEAREISPRSRIVIGGFCATIPNLKEMLGVDEVCIGEGISFMRELLGLPKEFKFKPPDVYHQDREILGVPIFGVKIPHIIVGLGCSYGCDFCAPSHFFGRRHIKLFQTGSELFQEMLRVEKVFKTNMVSFIGDDNFLLDLKRAEELRQCVVKSGKVFSIFLFGSADKVVEFGPERLAEMGANLIWIGREGKFCNYKKNQNIDLKALLEELRRYGIKTILSSILLLEEHTKENIVEDIEDHLACRPEFSQFAFYSPAPGTPLWERLWKEGRILIGIPYEELHAFKQPWFIHPEFTLREGEKVQEYAYLQDFYKLGPSLMRCIETDYEGWRNLKDSPKPHLRDRAEYFKSKMRIYKIMLLAMAELAPTPEMKEMIKAVLAKLESSFGKAGIGEKSIAQGLFLTGRFREFRTRHWGDALQPPTRIEYYNQSA